jgi:hypothetical protein
MRTTSLSLTPHRDGGHRLAVIEPQLQSVRTRGVTQRFPRGCSLGPSGLESNPQATVTIFDRTQGISCSGPKRPSKPREQNDNVGFNRNTSPHPLLVQTALDLQDWINDWH